MNKKKRIFLGIIFIILDLLLLTTFLVIRNAIILNNFNKEINKVENKSLINDRFNTTIKSRGSYREVEGAIKNYLNEYSTLLHEILEIIKDEKITKVLSYDNYKRDGKQFKESLKYLNETEEKFNNNIKKITDMKEEKNIIKYGNNNIYGNYYQDLYKKTMLSNKISNKFEETDDLIQTISPKITNVLKTSKEVLNFLVKNEKDWKLEDNEIRFKTKELYDEYTRLIKKFN